MRGLGILIFSGGERNEGWNDYQKPGPFGLGGGFGWEGKMSNERFKFRAWFHGAGDPRVNPEMKFSEPFPVIFWKAVEDFPFGVDVMQSTGLHDKNGKEIFEGDLLTSQTVHLFEDADIIKHPCQVIWLEDRAGFYLGLDGKAVGLSEYLAGWRAAVFEIIGNLYENPDLVGRVG
jgi:hypothetical protein